MQVFKITAFVASFALLAGCLSTPGERAVAGGLTGALLSNATGGNVVVGTALGAAAGAVSCGVPGLPRCR